MTKWDACLLCSLIFVAGCGDQFERYQGDRSASLKPWPLPPFSGAFPERYERRYGPEDDFPEGPFVGTGGDPRLELFDSSELYMVGTIVEFSRENGPDDSSSDNSVRGIAPVGRPDHAFVGLPERSSQYAIRPQDGRLLYTVDDVSATGIRVFHCDGCDHLLPEILDNQPNWTANDGVIQTPQCPIKVLFQITPEGKTVYSCDRELIGERGPWFDDADRAIPEPIAANVRVPRALRFGYADTILRQDGILDIATGQVSSFSGELDLLWSEDVVATRALPDGYWLIERSGADVVDVFRRFHIAFDGVASLEGTYPALHHDALSNALLDPDGNMIAAVEGSVRKLSVNDDDEPLYTVPEVSELPEDLYGHTHRFGASAVFGAVERPASVTDAGTDAGATP